MRLQFDSFSGDDEKAATEARETLVEDFGRWLESRPASGAEAFDADLLLNWKFGYGDGDFGTWTRSDVDEVLLEHLPRKLSASPAEAASIPVTLGAFVRYLDEQGLLSKDSDDATAIADRAMAQRQAFLDAMDNPSNWGMAKSFFAGSGLLGAADDVDQAALDAAMERFNALSFEERGRVLGLEDDDDEGEELGIALPLRLLPSPDEVEAASRDVPLLRHVDALHRALGATGIELTADGDPTAADARRLFAEIGTGDPVDGVRADLPALFAIVEVAIEAGAAADAEGDRLTAEPEWLDLTGTERWSRVVEAVLDYGASTLSFGVDAPGELAAHADEGAPHFVAMLWLAGEPLPLDAFADRLTAVLRLDARATAAPAKRARRAVARDRVSEVVDALVAAGILSRHGDVVELLPAGARVVAPLLSSAGYEALLPEDVAELDAAAVLDVMVERDDVPEVVAACWTTTSADRRRRAGELVAELAEEKDPERVLLGVGILGAFGEDAVEPLRGALDTPLAPQAWMLLAGAGAVAPDDVPPGMAIAAGIEALAGMGRAGSPADIIESMLGGLPIEEHVEFIDRLASTDHPDTADVLELIGRHHPQKAIAKHARKVAHRWRSSHAAPKRGP